MIGLDHQSIEGLFNGQTTLLALVRLSGDIPQDGQDRALNRLAHGLEGNLDGTTECGGDVRSIDGLSGIV